MNDHKDVNVLIVYNVSKRQLVSAEELQSLDALDGILPDDMMADGTLVDRYFEAEDEYDHSVDRYEVVLVQSDSLETVMKTHASYFENANDVMDELEDTVSPK